MTDLAMIVRGDDGGLGSLTWELARRLRPKAVVVMDLGGAGRGATHVERFDDLGCEVQVNKARYLTDQNMRWLLGRAPTVLTVETDYRAGHDLAVAARGRVVRSLVYAMPELYVDLHADSVAAPTGWRLDLLPPDARVVPFPMTDRFDVDHRRAVAAQRATDRARRFLHIPAPAMLDRNGSDVLLAAAAAVAEPVTIVVRGKTSFDWPSRVGSVTFEQADPCVNWWEGYSPDISALILPRRFGGLSLPMQEAAAAGIPTIATRVNPQIDWFTAETTIATNDDAGRSVKMAGGQVLVHEPDPEALARAIDAFVTRPDIRARARARSDAWAESWAWSKVEPSWRAWLAGEPPASPHPQPLIEVLSGHGTVLPLPSAPLEVGADLGLLSPLELEAMATSATLANQMRQIIGDGPMAVGDWAEACHEIHVVQRRIMGQAAARAYPDLFRLMGGVIASPRQPT